LGEQKKLCDELEDMKNEKISLMFKAVMDEDGNEKEGGAEKEEEDVLPDGWEEKFTALETQVKSLPKLSFTKEEITNLILKNADTMIASASVEDMEEVLLEASIRAFKAETTIARWENVRNVAEEAKWDEIKKTLVEYVISSDADPKDKLELLIQDKLYKQASDSWNRPVSHFFFFFLVTN